MASRRHNNSRFQPKTDEQLKAVALCRDNDYLFIYGVSGTGKTFAASGLAIDWLHDNKNGKIILLRPAVGAGEHLGYLPGTREEKIEPFLKPLFDCLGEFESCDDVIKADIQKRSLIEIDTFEHLRGRTFHDCFVIVDEAQNATIAQVKLVLSRLGSGSKMVLTGDTDQSDLRGPNGLDFSIKHLQGIDRLAFAEFTEISNQRHASIPAILRRFKANENNA